ncbi:NAD(P)H-dependent oxidoreductase [Acerihabitans sp. KWT182]|uniref:NAD(P)H-dependent oxidoreductase n=1 Tax=Acerihabitans sp. KWT182 TaxID=3157919 RepID=A0AAU7QCM6_9GAMM
MTHRNEQAQRYAPLVLLIMGSVRAGRLCPHIARWVGGIGRQHTDLDYEIVDLTQWPLPLDDEPGIPAAGVYSQAHSRAWSQKINGADAVVFVTPQYNWGYPAALKNAIDHLYREWNGKPAAIISYGGHGGGKCAEQLRQVAAALKMDMAVATSALTLPEDVIRRGVALKPEHDLASYADGVRLLFAELSTKIAATSAAKPSAPK